MYIKYKTTLFDPYRTERRHWEGADLMAEVRFETVLACEDGEWIENRVRKPSIYPVEAQEQMQIPVRRSSVLQTKLDIKPAQSNEDPETVTSQYLRAQETQVQFNLDSFTNATAIPPLIPLTSEIPPECQQEDILNKGHVVPPHQHLNSQAWLTQYHEARRPSLVPSLLPLPLGAQGQKGGEQREDISRRPSVMHMHEEEEEKVASLRPPIVGGRGARPRRPGLGRMRTAPERVDGVLQGN